MMSDILDLPADVTYPSRIADWIELQVLYSGKQISRSKILSIIDNVEETTIDSAIQELVRRLSLYGHKNPYKIDKNIIIPEFTWQDYPELTMCLLFSTHGASNAGNGTKLFERLTQSCIEFFWGFDSVNFGFPSGTSFKSQLDDLAIRCNERRGEDPAHFDKDRGVDIVAWKSFGDSRNSQIYMLVQCAAGGKWRDKKNIPLPSWRRFISWNPSTAVPAISIAQIIEIENWTNASDDYGLIIDRARLFRTITSLGYETDGVLKNEIINWCKGRFIR